MPEVAALTFERATDTGSRFRISACAAANLRRAASRLKRLRDMKCRIPTVRVILAGAGRGISSLTFDINPADLGQPIKKLLAALR